MYLIIKDHVAMLIKISGRLKHINNYYYKKIIYFLGEGLHVFDTQTDRGCTVTE